MKKLIVIMLLMFVSTTFAVSPSANSYRTTFGNGYAWSGHVPKDKATAWAQSVESAVDVGQLLGTGSVFYVDSGVTTEGGGTSWTSAKDTLDEGVGLCTASAGDFILVAQGHNEALTTADGVDVDVIGVTIIGIGNGSLKPTFDYDGYAGEFVIGADNVTIQNLRFRISTATTSAVMKAIDVEAGADYATIAGCEFGYAETAGTDYWLYTIMVNAATGTTIADCLIDSGEASAAGGITLSGADLSTIVNNRIIGDYSLANIYSATATNQRLTIENNFLWNGIHDSIGAVAALSLTATDSGLAYNNDVVCSVATTNIAMIGNRMLFGRNSITKTVGGSSTAWLYGVATNTAGSVTVTSN